MDQNALSKIEISRKSNKYCLFTMKTLQFLVPFSIVSFLLSYASGFSFFLSYNFHFSTFVFPCFAHALERKYMFLICNGILAFLAKTLNFNSSSLPASNFNDDEYSSLTNFEKPVFESTPANVALAVACQEGEVYAAPEKIALAEEDDPELERNGNEEVDASLRADTDEGREAAGASMLEAEDLDMMMSEVEEEEDMEEGGGPLGASAAEEDVEVNINTEELNKKFEEFIRKMKEEIRIQAQQPQLITV